jgi:FtsH-binding integral membrane protein
MLRFTKTFMQNNPTSRYLRTSNFNKLVTNQFNTTINNKNPNDAKTHLDEINTNQGLRKHLLNVYKYTGTSFGTTLASGSIGLIAISTMPSLIAVAPAIWLSSIGTCFLSIYKMTKHKSEVKFDEINKYYYEEINEKKKKWFWIFSISNGIMISPIISYGLAISPLVIPSALISTAGIYAGASYWALKQTNFDALRLERPLMGCLFGIIGASIVQLGAGLTGYHELFNVIDMGVTAASLIVFTGLVEVDTQRAIENYHNRTLDTIESSLQLALDATNIFIDMIKMISKISND